MAAIQIALKPDPSYALSVFCATGPTVPTSDILRRLYDEWLERYCEDPLRTSLRAWLVSHPLEMRILPIGAAPAPSLTALRQAGATDTEEGRLARATHEFVVTGRDTGEPRLALWNVVGMTRSIALQHAGVVLDRDVPRLVPIKMYTRRLESGVRVADFSTVLALPQPDGSSHLVLRGLTRFQLPLLQVDRVSPELQPQTALLLQVLAQVLVYRARRQMTASPSGTAARLAIPTETRLDLDHDALRRIAWKIDTRPNARRATLVHLAYAASASGREATLRLEPPPGFRGDARAWIGGMVTELLGGELPPAPTERDGPPLDPMTAATRRALDEMPELKRRYQKGLPSGHDVYVKRGFPLPDGSREFMWIHVSSWYDDVVKGRLATHPRHRTDLHAGKALQCAEEDVVDWLLIFPDGREMGGYTDQVPQTRKVPRPIPF